MRPDRSAVSHAVTSSKRQPKPRWKRRKDARPEEIVAAALEVFGERGFAATKLADVARRAGLTKGTVYLYFDSKEALFKAVVRETIVPVIAKGEAFAQSFTGSARELVEQLVRILAAGRGDRRRRSPQAHDGRGGNFSRAHTFLLRGSRDARAPPDGRGDRTRHQERRVPSRERHGCRQARHVAADARGGGAARVRVVHAGGVRRQEVSRHSH